MTPETPTILKTIEPYSKVCKGTNTVTSRNLKVLVQTHVTQTVARKFDAMARSRGHKRASYLRYIVEEHVRIPDLRTKDQPQKKKEHS